MRKIISRICITLGILLLLAALALVLYNFWDGKRAEKASHAIVTQWEQELEQLKEDTDADPTGTEIPLYKQYPEMDMPTITIDGYRYIGTLTVPEENLVLPVMEEWDMTRLKISPCRYSGSAYTNDLVIAGHNYAKHFSRLKHLPGGSVLFFTDAAGNEFHYKVASTETIDPYDIEGMTEDPEEQWDLTLFTCTTGGSARCAIRCILE